MFSADQAPVVKKVDSAIQPMNHYPVDSAIGFPNTYPLDSDLSVDSAIHFFNNRGQLSHSTDRRLRKLYFRPELFKRWIALPTG